MQRLLYILVYPILWIISILPFWLLYIKSYFFYLLVYYIIGYRRKVVKENLLLCFPEKSKLERKQIEKNFYLHLCDLIFETIKNLNISKKEIKKRFVYENPEVLDALYKNNKSILLMCGHYANWEWSGILSTIMPYQGIAVYKTLENKHFDKLVKKLRGRFGGTIVSNRKIVPFLYRLSKQGKQSLTLLVADQTPKRNAFKHKDTFMNVKVPVFTGTEEMAKKLDFAMVYLHISKEKRGYYKAKFIVLEENPNQVADFQITRLFFNELENQIKTAPAYYLWTHKRWKHRDK